MKKLQESYFYGSNSLKNKHLSPHNKTEQQLALWLMISLILLFGMVVLGGMTRLTGSGLSMVSWKPLTGFIPPLNTQDWETLFSDYQTSPEFMKVNFGMTLNEFKNIFWLEFIHRVWGRFIGIVFLIPVFICLKTSSLRPQYAPRIIFIWLLGAVQGAIGWYMVKSGLVNDPAVSHYRLATHLLLAFTTFGLILWVYLDLKNTTLHQQHISFHSVTPSHTLLYTALGLTFLTVFYGALVAGLKAGLIYNTFPTMNGAWVPDELRDSFFNWNDFFEQPGIVQWVHRILATSTVLAVTLVWGYSKNTAGSLKIALNSMMAVTLAQMALGIMTLLTQVPVWLGTLHQAGALLTVSSLLIVCHLSGCFSRRKAQSLNTRQNLTFKSLKKSPP